MFPSSFTTADNLKLKCSLGRSSRENAAVLIVVHGLGDHSGSLPYTLLEPFFVERDYAVLRFDLRGHGQSDGPRGHVNSWNDLRDDLGIFVELARQAFPALPIFLLGVSFGGLIVIVYAMSAAEEPAGVILAAPALSSDGASRLVRLVVPLLSRIVPRLSIDPGLDLQNISRDHDAARSYTSDPLFSTRLTIRLASETIKTLSKTQERASSFTAPILLLHGDADAIVPARSSQEFFDRVSSVNKRRIVYSGAQHNLLLETNRDQVYSDILSWADEQLYPHQNRPYEKQ